MVFIFHHAGRRLLERMGWLTLSSCALGGAACGTSSADDPAAGFEGPEFFEPGGANAMPQRPAQGGAPEPGAGLTGLDGLVQEPAGDGAVDVPAACIVSTADAVLVEEPVDIILLLDNSGSMSDELDAVEANINVNFANILADSGVDYRVILISRHRREPRTESGEASTSICVSTPLSGQSACDNAAEPIFSPRFFHYSTKLESTDSFDVMLDTYAPPFDGDREERFDQAPLGWSEWLRPGAKKVFLELTDDDEDMSVPELLGELTSMAPDHFGATPESPAFVFHSIVGVAEKGDPTEAYLPDEPLQEETCTGNDNDVANAGLTYQELSRLTGGLRFPLCQFNAYDVVFQRIAQDVVRTSNIACDFPIPPPPAGLTLDLEKVAIAYSPGAGGAAVQFGQAPTARECQPNAFYIENERLNLCAAACSEVRADPGASVSVLFTCESQLIVPR